MSVIDLLDYNKVCTSIFIRKSFLFIVFVLEYLALLTRYPNEAFVSV